MSASSNNDDQDHILVRNLAIRITLREDAWGRAKTQPGQVSLWVWLPLDQSGQTDNLTHSLSYSAAAKEALRALETRGEGQPWDSTGQAAAHTASHLSSHFGGLRVRVELEAENGALEVQSLGSCVTWDASDGSVIESASSFLRGLRVRTIVGIHPWERERKQDVHLTLTLQPHLLPLSRISHQVLEWAEASGYRTVEALASSLTSLLLSGSPDLGPIEHATVRVEKPRALPFAQGAGVQISRHTSVPDALSNPDMALPRNSLSSPGSGPPHIEAYIGMGANIGEDPAKNLSLALQAMSSLQNPDSIHVIDTSFLYLTEPMYVVDQPKFFNAVCHIRTSLSPQDLLTALKSIESSMGRSSPTASQSANPSSYIPKGPRPIDLDILIYQDLVMETPPTSPSPIRVSPNVNLFFDLCA
ncbi:hypothetical protein BJ684DRAFT_21411, partial [Piptocephalis cylindrospora]